MRSVGTDINVNEKPPVPGGQVDTATAFVGGQCGRGATDEGTHVYSMADVELFVGPRSDGQTLYDWLDAFFGEGGRHAVVGRVVGTTPVNATTPLFDAAGSTATDDSLHVTAKTPGEWGNSLNVEVVDGDAAGEFKIVITHDSDDRVAETSPSLADRDAAVAWGETATWVDISLGDSAEDPRVQGPTGLTLGDDDDGTIADAHWATALATLDVDLGPGQVAAPGRTTSTGHGQLLEHARDFNRAALLDLANTSTVATLITAGLAVRALASNLARYGFVSGNWWKIPGVAGGTLRSVPDSAVHAGQIARAAAAGLSVNDPVAGENGIVQYAVEPAVEFTDEDDFNDLLSAGVNVAQKRGGQYRRYGYRTAVNAFTAPNWVAFTHVRFLMQFKSRADSILESYVLKKIDPKRLIFRKLYSQLEALCMEYGADLNSYVIDTDTVNTSVSIANREINASVDLDIAGFSEKVRLNLSKTTQGV